MEELKEELARETQEREFKLAMELTEIDDFIPLEEPIIGPNEIQYEKDANSKDAREQVLAKQLNDRSKYAD